MSALLSYLTAELRYRWQLVRDTKDGGYTTESVVVTAVLITIALAVIAIIGTKLVGKANSLNLG
ncbi:hypothetical protein GCM10020358_57950 [Amorphoplanes nipponensis]|uniref:Uncharacterized protein n=1 Tax=Actinoplanes nipponensis TaxID=135950 RepID=A0A919JKJ1_9ACTN|nr:hypothetical protein [Actinoplanes nipponensis]GIE52498.1 hypothetical protein Ani05nite_60320 [Actinoplanes nipponensis]